MIALAMEKSKSYNLNLANAFFKSGMIEAWGRGFDKIREACREYNAPLPEYEINEEESWYSVKPVINI